MCFVVLCEILKHAHANMKVVKEKKKKKKRKKEKEKDKEKENKQDGMSQEISVDLDGDGVADIMGIDLDGDGTVDVIGEDKDGDGIMDEWSCGHDCGFSNADYHLVVEHEKTCTAAERSGGLGILSSFSSTGKGFAGFTSWFSPPEPKKESDEWPEAVTGIDLDGDGKADIVGVDRDGDGIIDDWECTNACGFKDADYDKVVEHETQSRGKKKKNKKEKGPRKLTDHVGVEHWRKIDPEGVSKVIGVDIDGSGKVDVIGVSTKGDGTVDQWVCGNMCGFTNPVYGVLVDHRRECTYIEDEHSEGAGNVLSELTEFAKKKIEDGDFDPQMTGPHSARV